MINEMRKEDKVAYTGFGGAAGIPAPGEYVSEARAILRMGSNRFHLAIAFIICVVACAAAFFGIFSAFWLFEGRETEEEFSYFYIEIYAIILSLCLASPFFHGYKITVARTAKTGQTDLTDMFVMFSSCRMFFASLYSGLVSAGPSIFTLVLYALAVRFQSYLLLFACPLLFAVMFFLFRRGRRVARINAAYPENGFSYARRAAKLAPAAYRRTHLGVGAAFFPQFLLAAVTLLITGVYNTFAQYSLASALTVTDLKIRTITRKDDIK